ncbi:MAG: hypothetical protein KC656_07270 [Myxococcales bacterium]|nr:hypothetical protein [Myxococcales bacterium]
MSTQFDSLQTFGPDPDAQETAFEAPPDDERIWLGELIGRGGSAEVRAAVQPVLGRQVAVKRPRHDAGKHLPRRSLLREAWITGALEHPNIVPIHDVGLDAEGRPVPNAQGREGWVRVHPYWEADPTVTIRMCAYDAQDTVVSSNGTVCADQNGRNDPNCGCGPDLAYCVSPDFVTDLRASLAGTLDARVKAVLTADAPYSELLTADRMYVNGPLVHYFRNQSKVPASVRLDLAPLDIAALPDLDPWEVDHWVEVPVHAGHSGALTDPAFLTRFMSNRSRVNQFWNAFLCQPFTAPAGGIAGLDVQNPTLDLANRDGCRYCHAIIEPSKAHWGRWTEGGGGWLDPAVYPSFDADCETCSESSLPCDDACRRYYTVDPLSPELDPFVGSLSAYQFLPDAEHHRVDDGPEGLVEENIANGRLPTCVSQKTAGWLLGREPTADDDPLVAAWTDELLASGWDYRTLVRSIVLSEPYRRSR